MMAAASISGCGSSSSQPASTTAAQTTAAQTEAKKEETTAAETEAAKDPVTLTFWDENAGEKRTPYYEELIKRFNESQDRITVVYEGIPSSSAKEKYDVAISTKTTPDIGHCNAAWGSNWVAQECLVPLDDYFNSWDESKDINENYLRLNRELDPEGRLFMITDTVSTPLMWVRTDLFKEKGVEIPTTWDEFFDAAEKMTDASQGVYGFALRGDGSSCVELQHVLYAYSGIENYFDENGQCTINAPEHVEFLKRYQALYNTCTAESDITNGYKEMVAAFDGGSAAMIFHNTGSAGEHAAALQPDQYKAVSFPKSLKGTYSYTAGSQGGYCIFDTCSDPDAAWEFIKFMLSEESNSYWNKSIGQIPMNNKVLSEAWVAESQATNEALNTLASSNCFLVSQPKYLPDYSTIMNTNNPPNFQAMLLGEMSVESFLDEWARQMTEAYAEYQAQ
jgi:multiple sugar transport system substrate-binding protein